MGNLKVLQGGNYVLVALLASFFHLTHATANIEIADDSYKKCPNLLKEILSNRNTETDSCKAVTCENVISRDLCPPETIYEEKFALCDCCPACVRYLGVGDSHCTDDRANLRTMREPSCDTEDNYCPVHVNLCLPGLVCEKSGSVGIGKCRLPSIPLSGTCLYRKSLYRLGLLHWDPLCEPDGSFSPKQCKGSHYSGECFCVDGDGRRIFGREWRIQAENQTCACSRMVSDLRKREYISTFHCTPDGNFEPLQCDTDTGLCYCVDEQTGVLVGGVVPTAQWKLLPCYSFNITNGSSDGRYLRTCESEYAAIRAIVLENNYHGTRVELKRMNCDYDGSFSPVLNAGTGAECVFKNGTRILNYMGMANSQMNCRCARDVNEYYPSHEMPRQWGCELSNGNYLASYDFGSYSSCVDQEGFLFGDIADSKRICCIQADGCSAESAQYCYYWGGVVNPLGIRNCSFWPFNN